MTAYFRCQPSLILCQSQGSVSRCPDTTEYICIYGLRVGNNQLAPACGSRLHWHSSFIDRMNHNTTYFHMIYRISRSYQYVLYFTRYSVKHLQRVKTEFSLYRQIQSYQRSVCLNGQFSGKTTAYILVASLDHIT